MKFKDSLRWWNVELKEINSSLKNLKATRVSKREVKVAACEQIAHTFMKYAKVLSEE